MSETSDVIVIGAGLSGLCAAKYLTQQGLTVTVLEARDRVGGRTLTKHDPKVNYVDIGAAYVGPTQNRLLRLAKELNVETYKVNEIENLLVYKDGTRYRVKPTTSFMMLNPFRNMDLNNIMYLLDKMGEEIPSEAPWDAPHADEWDTMTFKEFLKENCWTKAAKKFFDNLVPIFFTSETYEASLLSVLWYIKQCDGTKRILGTTNGAQERKFIGGTQQFSIKLAAQLKNVVMNSPVVEINQENKGLVRVKTLNGKIYEGQYAILALPPMLQMKIHFRPSLPALRNQLMPRLPMGSISKVIIYYKSTFWREKGLCGSLVIEGNDKYPLSAAFDDTKPDGTFPAIIGFIACDKIRRLCLLSEDERKNMVAKSLAKVTGLEEFLHPIHYEEKNWMEEEYSGGCYTALYPPGFFTRYGRYLRDPIQKLYFAGTETAVEWSGYMEGAIEAGERAARQILNNMGKIPKDQIYQKEPESKDIIPKPFKTPLLEKYLPSVSGFIKIVSAMSIVTAVTVLALKFNCVFI